MFRKLLTPKPLVVIIALAISLRLVAVICSQGFMAHDDHFETIEIANSWQHEGMYLDDGSLRWEGKPDIGVLRSAVYNIFLLGLMKITSAVGIEHLDTHMYFNRLVHALLSLLPVIFGYRYLKQETDEKTATIGGLILAGHFLMPFLSVRNLAEMVAADFLFPALYYATASMKRQSDFEALLAGVLGGIAFMVRMQVIMALAVIPIAMVIRRRTWRQAIVFSAAVGLMIVLQGVIDIDTHGKFLGSVTNYIAGNLGAPPTIPAPWYRYILLVFGIMIPPFSLIFIGSIFHKKVIRNHIVLWLPLMVFMIGHSIITNKQERFIIPVFPIIIVLGCVGIYHLCLSQGWWVRWKGLRLAFWGWFVALNVAALIPFTLNYGHRGAVDPLVYLSRQPDAKSVLFDCSERKMFIPYSYWQYDRSRAVTAFSQDELDSLITQKFAHGALPEYVVVFSDTKLKEHVAYLYEKLGLYAVVHHGAPSIMDVILNKLNPKYNYRNESWVLKKT